MILMIYAEFTHDTLNLRRIYIKYTQLLLNTHDLPKVQRIYTVFTHYLRDLLNNYA